MQKTNLKRRFNKPAFKVAEKPKKLTWTKIMKKAKRKALSYHMEIAAGPKGNTFRSVKGTVPCTLTLQKFKQAK